MLIGVYLVFKVTTSYEKLHQDNSKSIERYVILCGVVKLYKNLEIAVSSSPRDNSFRDNFLSLWDIQIEYQKNIKSLGNIMFSRDFCNVSKCNYKILERRLLYKLSC